MLVISGHGTQVPDFSGDELNGLSETILPLDYRQQGPIIDDTINEILVNPLPPGCRLHAVIDACHSGSGLTFRWFHENSHADFHRLPSIECCVEFRVGEFLQIVERF